MDSVQSNSPVLDTNLGCNIGKSWTGFFDSLKRRQKFSLESILYPELKKVVNRSTTVPVPSKWLAWTLDCSLDKLKVLIVTHDCIDKVQHGHPVANGIAFSSDIPHLITEPLKVIYDSLESNSLLKQQPKNSDLTSWIEQGVALINLLPTAEQNSRVHNDIGWYLITVNAVLSLYEESKEKLCIVLVGAKARSAVEPLINLKETNTKVIVLNTGYPSRWNKHSSKFDASVLMNCNKHLLPENIINWNL